MHGYLHAARAVGPDPQLRAPVTHPVSPGAVLRQSYNQLNGIGGIDVEREASAARASLANALQHHAPVMANSGVVLDPVALSGYAAAPARSAHCYDFSSFEFCAVGTAAD